MSPGFHRERQQMAAWVHVVVAVALAGSVAAVALIPAEESHWWIALPVLIGLGVYLLFTPMTVEVDVEAMHVRFGRLNWPRWVFPLREIEDVRVVTFRPLRDYGGWGIRRGSDGYCLNQRGDRGVRFEHAGGTYTVGSDNPERLLEALRTAGADIKEG